jgi:hypothetical protein
VNFVDGAVLVDIDANLQIWRKHTKSHGCKRLDNRLIGLFHIRVPLVNESNSVFESVSRDVFECEMSQVRWKP